MPYKKNFLSRKGVALPILTRQQAYKIFHYTNFTVCHNVERKLPWFTVVNIDGLRRKKQTRKRDKWMFEDAIDQEDQLGGYFYALSSPLFDKGHLVRRLDPCWGPQAKRAEMDTFKYVNCAPQHRRLNRTAWLELEKNVLEKGSIEHRKKISVFTGPVLDKQDYFFIKEKKNKTYAIQIPSMYWKIIIWKKSDLKLYAVGFIISQWEFLKHDLHKLSTRGIQPADDYFENLKFKNNASYQVDVKTIQNLSGIRFNWPTVKFPYTNKVHTQLHVRKKMSAGKRGGSSMECDYEITNLIL